MKRLFVLIMALFCLMSCAPIFHYTSNIANIQRQKIINVYIDRDFNAREDIIISDALNEWNYALNNQIHFEVKTLILEMDSPDLERAFNEENSLLIMKTGSQTFPYIQPKERGKVTSFVGANRKLLYVFKDINLTSEELHGILLHELGHVLKAVDIKDINSLMNFSYKANGFQCIDQKSVQMVAEINHLNVTFLNYCLSN